MQSKSHAPAADRRRSKKFFRTRKELDALYLKYNRREFLGSDPVLFVHRFQDPRDMEIAGIVAACLALGRVAMILRNVEKILAPMKPTPSRFLARASRAGLRREYAGFKHRFITSSEMVCFLESIGRILGRYGSLNAAFLAGQGPDDATVLPALCRFTGLFDCGSGRLIASPERGSACKRLNLYLRWMVRRDAIDVGAWSGVSKAGLVAPLDTHLFRAARDMGWTCRRSADLKAALQATEALRAINPADPLKYDFALTRPGILASLSEKKRAQIRA